MATPDPVREIVLTALRAARYGTPPPASIVEAIRTGDRVVSIDELKFDSLAWMEFCISIELQSGQELVPADIERMQRVVGCAAVLAAFFIARGASICGCLPQSHLKFPLSWQLEIRRAWGGQKPELEFVYGADFDLDRSAALSMKRSFGGRLRPIPGIDNHNVLGMLLKRGELPEFLDEMRA